MEDIALEVKIILIIFNFKSLNFGSYKYMSVGNENFLQNKFHLFDLLHEISIDFLNKFYIKIPYL